jgi:hypothetical protein
MRIESGVDCFPVIYGFTAKVLTSMLSSLMKLSVHATLANAMNRIWRTNKFMAKIELSIQKLLRVIPSSSSSSLDHGREMFLTYNASRD